MFNTSVEVHYLPRNTGATPQETGWQQRAAMVRLMSVAAERRGHVSRGYAHGRRCCRYVAQHVHIGVRFEHPGLTTKGDASEL